jgi:hypothetical protein
MLQKFRQEVSFVSVLDDSETVPLGVAVPTTFASTIDDDDDDDWDDDDADDEDEYDDDEDF